MFLVVLASLLVALIVAGSVVNVLTDRLWFKEVHYSQVFSTMLWTRLVMFSVVGVVMAAIVGGNLYLAYRLRPLLRPRSAEQHALERYRTLLTPHIGWWFGIIATLIGLLAGASGQGHWQTWLLFRNGGSFGVKDQQFGKDIGWYIFDYPFWRYLVGIGFTSIFLALLGALAVHYLFGGVRLQGEGERMTTGARAQLTSLVAAFVLLKAVAYFLDQRGLVLGHNSSIDLWGAGYTDVKALLPAKEILAWISVIVAIAILVFSNAFFRNLVWPGMALGLLALAVIAIGGIYPFVVQTFTVKPNPLNKEAVYIQRSIDATREAFGLTDKNLQTDQLAASNGTPPAVLHSDTGTVPNIRLLDPAVVADTYTALQRARGFYDFGEKLDIDRYTTASKTQDYVVGVREIDYNSPNGKAWNWQNAHTIYTHGDGFVAAPANKTVCDGTPFFVSGILGSQADATGNNGEACLATTDQFPVSNPGIYYGENMGSYAIVGQPQGTSPVEYDGPNGASSDAYVTYTGKGGVSVSSYWRRMLYAYKFKEPNFLISSVFNDDSKILYIRDPRERVEKIAPFLTIDGDPYPAVIDGHITWILDGYTTASTYPYSDQVDLRSATSDAQVGNGIAQQASQNINYLRNSVKATVDAYDGTVTLYAFGGADPIRDAWNKAFGGHLIKPETSIPTSLSAHFRYPEDQFKVQRDLLTRFHVTDAQDFYSGQDFWQVPVDPARESDGLKQPPYYLLAKFPDQDATTFQLTSAMVRPNQPNLSSLITASYGADGTPQIQILEIPKGTSTVSGPTQVQQLMQNDPTVRTNLTLFTSKNSAVVYGNLLSLPIGGGILYVEPIYIKSTENGSYPLMKKVLLSYGNHIAYADTVDQGISQLLGQTTPPTTPPGGTTTTPPGGSTTSPPASGSTALDKAVQQINKALADLKTAQMNGDYAGIGKAEQDLANATAAYQKALAASQTPVPPSTAPGG
jgi:uncharacterized membrane protein (UPF0182 family)